MKIGINALEVLETVGYDSNDVTVRGLHPRPGSLVTLDTHKGATDMHAYEISVGCTVRLPLVYGDDVKARKVCARWIRLFWPRYVRTLGEKHPHSIAYGEAVAGAAVCTISRSGRLLSGDVIPAAKWTRLDTFELSPEPIRQFVCAYDAPHRI